MKSLRQRIASVASFSIGLFAATSASAGGFEIPGGGAASLGRGAAWLVRVDDPTAVFWNPGALTRLRGTHLLYDHTLVFDHTSFTRQESDLPPGQDYGFDPLATVENDNASLFALGAKLFVTTDFGLDDWTFAAGIYGPNAHGKRDLPTDGGQRYMLTGLDAILLYPSLAVAYGKKDCFGIGATFQWVMVPSMKLSLVVDGSPSGELHAYYSGNDVEATIELSDMTSFSAIVGGWWRPIPELEVAASGRVVPAALDLAGKFSLKNVPGQTQFTDQQLSVPGSAARMDLTLPPTAQVGARYRHLDGAHEVFDVELDVVYEAWSMLEQYNVELDGTINLFVGAQAPDTVIQKRWKDTLSVRLGSTINVIDHENTGLQLSLGGYWESGAVPEGYEHLDFLSFDRFGVGFGVAGRFGLLKLSLGYNHVFQEDRDVDERFAKVYQQRPLDPCPEQCDGGKGWSGVPANAGHYETGYDLLSASIEAAF